MSSNVHVAKASLYAADAGIRTAQQQLASFSTAKLESLSALYTGTGPVIAAPLTFFPGGSLVGSATNPKFTTSATIAFSDSDLTDTAQVYNYRYTITSTGNDGQSGTRAVQSQGILRVSAGRGSFAQYLIYTNTHTMGDGSNIWFTSSGYFDGRVHTNTEFKFAYKPTFEDLITSVNSKAWYYNKGNNVELSANNNGSIDVPNLYGGFTRGAPNVPLPVSAYSQKNASLGRDPSDTASPTNTQIRAALGMTGGSAPPNGIYLPSTGGAMVAGVLVGATLSGGIYVQGDLNSCAMRVDSLGRQVYTMTQGSVMKRITVDPGPVPPLTYVWDGSATTIYTGAMRPIMYTQGTMADLGGPDRSGGTVVPAIANGNQMLITASGDIVIQNDITAYDYDNGEAVLGIYSSGGDVRIGSGAPNDANLDAFVMAAGSNGEFKVDNWNSGAPMGTFHLRGGMVASYYGVFYQFDSNGNLLHGFARDFHYDRRGLVPPYFPTTNQFVPDLPSARTLAWKEL
jgi:hypothetical protein